MMDMTAETKVLQELKSIKEDVEYIKEHMVNVDTILTDDDLESIHDAERDLKEGKTKRLM
jgi:hypothetical protein